MSLTSELIILKQLKETTSEMIAFWEKMPIEISVHRYKLSHALMWMEAVEKDMKEAIL